MTDDEIGKAIEFLLDQQARVVTDLQKLADNELRITDATLANTGHIERLVDMMERLTDAVARTDERVSALAQVQGRMDARVSDLTQTVAAIVERLHAFIVVVERYISFEGRNAKK